MKKIILKILLYLFLAIIIFISLPMLIGLIPSIDTVNAVFIRNADFESADLKTFANCKWIYDNQEKAANQLVHFHRIKSGNGVILAYRRYDQGNRSTLDDEDFEKVTILLPELVSGKFELGKDSKVRGYYTAGGSAWVRSVCGGELTQGNVEILKTDDGELKVRIQSTVYCEKTDLSEQQSVFIETEQVFKEISLNQVTPWIGKWSKRYYDEVYPDR